MLSGMNPLVFKCVVWSFICLVGWTCATTRTETQASSAYLGPVRTPTVELGQELLLDKKDEGTQTVSWPPQMLERLPHLQTQVQHCYDSALRLFPGLDGQLLLQLMLNRTGHVENAQIKSSSINNMELEQCVERSFMTLKIDPFFVAQSPVQVFSLPVFFRLQWGGARR